jgi:hypothetical protein
MFCRIHKSAGPAIEPYRAANAIGHKIDHHICEHLVFRKDRAILRRVASPPGEGGRMRSRRRARLRQFGRASALMMPHRVHTMRGPNNGTGEGRSRTSDVPVPHPHSLATANLATQTGGYLKATRLSNLRTTKAQIA